MRCAARSMTGATGEQRWRWRSRRLRRTHNRLTQCHLRPAGGKQPARAPGQLSQQPWPRRTRPTDRSRRRAPQAVASRCRKPHGATPGGPVTGAGRATPKAGVAVDATLLRGGYAGGFGSRANAPRVLAEELRYPPRVVASTQGSRLRWSQPAAIGHIRFMNRNLDTHNAWQVLLITPAQHYNIGHTHTLEHLELKVFYGINPVRT